MVKGSKMKLDSRIKMSKSRSGDKHWNWNGGKSISKQNGYVLVKTGVGNGTYKLEHRLVMEKHICRKLKPFPFEVVHHKNGIRTDNRIENLELMTATAHAKEHNHLEKINSIRKANKVVGLTFKCSKCNKFLKIRNKKYMFCRTCCRHYLEAPAGIMKIKNVTDATLHFK